MSVSVAITQRLAAIRQCYEAVWGVTGRVCHWPHGPTGELPPGFCVVEYGPDSQRKPWVYATCGMSLARRESLLELHLLSPHAADEHVELLTAIAHFHTTGTALDLGHTVNFGRPWLPDSTCSIGLVSLPYLYGPKLENCPMPNGPNVVRCLWLLPITEAEREFKKQNGQSSLELLFEQHDINYLDPGRESVI